LSQRREKVGPEKRIQFEARTRYAGIGQRIKKPEPYHENVN